MSPELCRRLHCSDCLHLWFFQEFFLEFKGLVQVIWQRSWEVVLHTRCITCTRFRSVHCQERERGSLAKLRAAVHRSSRKNFLNVLKRRQPKRQLFQCTLHVEYYPYVILYFPLVLQFSQGSNYYIPIHKHTYIRSALHGSRMSVEGIRKS